MSETLQPERGRRVAGEAPAGGPRDLAALFARLWAAAMLFHITTAPMRFQALPPTLLGVDLLAVGLVALAVLVRPRDVRLLVALAGLQVLSVWLEAPLVGNHWVIAGFVNLALLGAAAAAWRREGRLRLAGVFPLFAPVARWTLLIFYSLAAFSKLNTAFLDPAVSCATFFLSESLGVFGLDPLAGRAGSGLGHAVVAASLATELAVPVLLVFRRTRRWGVLLGVVFHGLIALDLAHPFFDFSSLLFALFVLFLPAGFAGWLHGRLDRSGRAGRLLEAGRNIALVVALAALLAALGPPTTALGASALLVTYLLWFGYVAAAVVFVAWYVLAGRPGDRAGMLGLPGRPAVLLLLLVALNGLTPYLELKTAFGYTMYANLVTVEGETNHLLVPGTLPLTDVHGDLVRIRSSEDPDLQWYADNDYALPWLTFRAHLDERPATSVTYVRGGEVHTGVPEVEPVPAWQEKLMVFREVDLREPKRCQDTWAPSWVPDTARAGRSPLAGQPQEVEALGGMRSTR